MRALLPLIALLAPLSVPAQDPAARGLVATSDVVLRIHNLAGATRVIAWDRDSIHVTATIAPGGGRLYAAGTAAAVKLGTEQQDPAPHGGGASLVIHVPRAARVWVKSASARVSVEGVRGEVEVSTVTGDVDCVGDPRVATLETIDGNVTVRGAATVLRVRTGAGAARVFGARGNLVVSTVQGPIVVEAADVLSARLESVSGTVDVAATLASGRLEIQTHESNVRVRLARPVEARFDLETVNGRVVTQLFDRPERVYPDGVARFSVGTAGARAALVTARSFKGEIRVDSNPKL